MKKTFILLLACLTLLFLFSNTALAADEPVCIDPVAGGGSGPAAVGAFIKTGKGLVPCGQTQNPDGTLACPCQLSHFLVMAFKIYNFVVYIMVLPFTGLLILIGGLLMILSGGSQKMLDRGKGLIKYSLMAVVIIFCSWLIVDIVLKAVGYLPDTPWWRF